MLFFFCFKQKSAYELRISDWSSDVCSSDLPLSHVDGSLNAVVAEGNFVGRLFFQGAGAGDGPTASAVVADLIDVARGEYGPAFGMPVDSLDRLPKGDAGKRTGRVYLRFKV